MSKKERNVCDAISCASCIQVVCQSGRKDLAAPECPMQTDTGLIEKQLEKYAGNHTQEFARQASIQEFECYLRLPDGLTTVKPRVLETMEFADKMGYKKLGLAFCGGLRNEARTVNQILENHGFEDLAPLSPCAIRSPRPGS
jgi:uncharacterized metal-binding protein